jgi:hypothetical protein
MITIIRVVGALQISEIIVNGNFLSSLAKENCTTDI